MSNFVVVVSPPGRAEVAGSLFRRGLEASRRLALGSPRAVAESGWFRVATLPRADGSGATLVRDPLSGGWLLAIGTWFHGDGYASGAESRLLHRIAERGIDDVAHELEGAFVLVHADARAREIQVLTDVTGSCPAFQRVESGVVTISGSSLLLATLGDARLDPVAAQELVTHGVIGEDRTLHREVRRLKRARIHRFAAHGAHVAKRYWDAPRYTMPSDEAADALWEALVRASNRMASLHPRLVCELGDAPESRLVAAGLTGAKRAFSTTSAAREGTREARAAEALAAKIGVAHLPLRTSEPSSLADLHGSASLADGECDLVHATRIFDVHRLLARSWNAGVCALGGAAPGAADPIDPAVFRSAARPDGLGAPADLAASRDARILGALNRVWSVHSPFVHRTVIEAMLAATEATRCHARLAQRALSRHERRLARVPGEWPAFLSWLRHVRDVAPPPASAALRLRLWREDDVRALLQPRRMRAAEILDPVALERFFEASRAPAFPHDAQWARILTLETTLTVVANVRSQLAANIRVLRPAFRAPEHPVSPPA